MVWSGSSVLITYATGGSHGMGIFLVLSVSFLYVFWGLFVRPVKGKWIELSTPKSERYSLWKALGMH